MTEPMRDRSFPNEILENIFVHLPISDLLLSKCLVNKQWNDVISREGFIPWKKRYNRYRLCPSGSRDSSYQFLQNLCAKNEITDASNCLKSLIKYMASQSVIADKEFEKQALIHLKAHPKFDLVMDTLVEKFEGVSEDNVSLWAVITGIICIFANDSDGVVNVYSLFNLLINSKTTYMSKEIIEKIYCIATFLLYFERKYQIASRLHYNVIYALHLYENCWGAPSDSRLTQEQLRIINHHIQLNDLVKIVAYAGTGKTTTLVNFTKRWSELKFLVLYFNKSMSDDACSKFPVNAKCMTVHALAKEPTMILHHYLSKKKIKNLFVSEIQKALGYKKGFQLFVRERLVHDTISRFFGSADEDIMIDHCPNKIKKTDQILSIEQKQDIVSDTKEIWEMLKSPLTKLTKDSQIKHLPHDAYLKLFQLSRPNLYKLMGVDVIIIDEGQDMSGSMLGIFNQQKGPRMIVGDPAQQIYQWRYAVNALDKVSATHTFYLTQSFRFGPNISFLANSLLSYCTPNHNNWLVGTNVKDEFLSADQPIVSGPGQVAYIARTNSALFQKAVEIIQKNSVQESISSPKKLRRSIKVAFAGGLKGYGFENLTELNYMRRGDYDLITHPYLKCFRNKGGYTTFTDQVETLGDSEWAFKIVLVNWAEDHITEYVRLINDSNVDDLRQADAIFTTTHKSKGMEWETVCLLDDFAPELTKNQSEQEEANVLYVAATRAKRSLVINPACFYTLTSVGERFEKAIRTRDQISNCPCGQVLPGLCAARTVSISRPTFSLMAVNKDFIPAIQEGTLCSTCAGFIYYSPPRFHPYCGSRSLPCHLKRIEKDGWRAALRFIFGPKSEEDEQKVKAFYNAELARLRGGFIQANQLIMGMGIVAMGHGGGINNAVVPAGHPLPLANGIVPDEPGALVAVAVQEVIPAAPIA